MPLQPQEFLSEETTITQLQTQSLVKKFKGPLGKKSSSLISNSTYTQLIFIAFLIIL